ncbi:MAG TPA: ABC transporter permease subunit [Methylomirabilota bacterium]|nr:ABC transporter permease subunit [Methylomirabilota bacterium]
MRSLASELRKDRLATLTIRAGGITVILLVVAMVVAIGAQALPLFAPTTVGPVAAVAEAEAVAVGFGPRSFSVWWLGRGGRLTAAEAGGEPAPVVDLGTGLRSVDVELGGVVTVVRADGSWLVGRVGASDPAEAPAHPGIGWRELAKGDAGGGAGSLTGGTAVRTLDGGLLVALWGPEGVELAEWQDGGPVVAVRRIPLAGVTSAALAGDSDHLALVDGAGALQVLRLADLAPLPTRGLDRPVTRARFLHGGRTLVATELGGAVVVAIETPRVAIVNEGRGGVEIGGSTVPPGGRVVAADDGRWDGLAGRTEVRVGRVAPEWRAIHRLEPPSGSATAIATAPRGRCFAIADDTGGISLYNATSGRLLTRSGWASSPLSALALAPRGDALAAVADGRVLRAGIDHAHPEISLRTLFLPVWYEGYGAPATVWQTSGGSDGFQPKFGLWPLLVGTLKATLYAMVVSVPLALLAALYVSQLAPPWLQTVVKPTVEMMAAVPTVVVGFLAALWLAPRLELWLFPCLVAAATLPAAVAVAVPLWRALPTRFRRRFPKGAELVLLLAGCGLAVVLAVAVAGPVEARLFDGDFSRALFETWGIRYEQRNGLVIGLALGFAVIPVIFTIAEDACSGVSRSLVQAALALGATRWQAALRLVVPAAAPGLFAAVMLGLGRAVGETMIVLMAAGNTPILDLGPFNGMRTMSAAIAFETPEAAVGGTLYRVLFLTGFLLFVLSVLFTTAADLVSARLRRRHAEP